MTTATRSQRVGCPTPIQVLPESTWVVAGDIRRGLACISSTAKGEWGWASQEGRDLRGIHHRRAARTNTGQNRSPCGIDMLSNAANVAGDFRRITLHFRRFE